MTLNNKFLYETEDGYEGYKSYLIKEEVVKKKKELDNTIATIKELLSDLEDEYDSIEKQIEYQNKQNRRNNEINRYLNEMQQYGSPYGNSYILPGMRWEG